MGNITITRGLSSSEGTPGILHINNIPQCITLEPVITDIPDGTYNCIPHSGPKFQNVWEVQKVPGHSAILIHNGNTVADTHGCILVGQSFATINGHRGITNSNITLNNLRQILPSTFNLTIRSLA